MLMKKIRKPKNSAFVKINTDDATVVWIRLEGLSADSGADSVQGRRARPAVSDRGSSPGLCSSSEAIKA